MDATGKRRGRPAAMRALKPGLIALVVLAALSIAYVVFWLFMAGELRDGVARWSEERRAEGYTVLFSRLHIGGFPFVLRLDLERPGLGAPDGGIPWTWEGERAVAEMRPWNLRHVDIDLSGAHTLGLVVAGRPVTYTGTAGDLTGVLVMADAWPSSAEIHIKDLDLSTAGGAERVVVKRADLTARRKVGKTSDDHGSTVDVRLRAEDVRVPERLSLPLGNHLSRLTVAAGLLGPIPAGPWPQSLGTWRDEGGTVEVERLGITYGPLSAQATGTVALDGNMQPIGAFTATVRPGWGRGGRRPPSAWRGGFQAAAKAFPARARLRPAGARPRRCRDHRTFCRPCAAPSGRPASPPRARSHRPSKGPHPRCGFRRSTARRRP